MDVTYLIIALWIAFLAYLGVSSIGIKKNVQGGTWMQGAGFRILSVLVVLLLLQFEGIRRFLKECPLVPSNPIVEIIGVILCVTGLTFAIWARVNLGRNWGMPMSLKKGHELVTTGPYRFVRHPIYTGVLLAAIGSALAGGSGIIWLAIFGFLCAYFVYSAKVEERLMMKQFPNQYFEYKKRTKMLVPFLV